MMETSSPGAPTSRPIAEVLMPYLQDEVRLPLEGTVLYYHSIASSLQDLRNRLKTIKAAGGVVYNQRGDLLMIYRKGRWDLPKGKLEPDESPSIAALREVEEETGIGNLTLLAPFAVTYHLYREKEWILKETEWFEMTSTDQALPIPQSAEGITDVKWIPRKSAAETVRTSFGNVKRLVRDVEVRGLHFPHPR